MKETQITCLAITPATEEKLVCSTSSNSLFSIKLRGDL